jgi:DNA-binding transcriptional regulator YiaG
MSPFDPKSINELRADLGMSQRQFANNLGVPHATVYRWEGGVSQPNANNLGQMHDLAVQSGLTPNFFHGTVGVKLKDNL